MTQPIARFAMAWLLASLTLHAAAGELAVSEAARAAAKRADELMRACRYDEADAAVASALEDASPADRKLLLLTAGMLAEHRNDAATALRHYEEAAAGEQVALPALRMLGRARIANREFAEGHEALLAYVMSMLNSRKQLPSREDLAALAVASAELGHLPDALQLLELMLKRVSEGDPLGKSLKARIEAARVAGSPPEAGAYWRMAYGGDQPIGSPAEDFALVPVRRVQPAYPRTALRDNKQGSVVMYLRTDASGSVTQVSVLESTDEMFSREARAAVLKWKFKPRVEDCKAVPGEGIQVIDFRLGN